MSNTERVHAVIKPGDVLVGKYRVERVLGAGGMGMVVAAHHIQLDEKVALKFLLSTTVHSPEAVTRFLREARAAVKIKNEHVARVTDVGQLEDGSPYIVMEYLDGSDLSQWLKQHGSLPFEQAVDFVLQACEALADAHALGIVHRDLKPANLFCVQRSDGRLSIKVLDFGISKVTTPGAAGHDMTRTNALMGSPLYMSPEQMQQSKGVDARTDIWSLGVILFELLSGRPPFTAEAVTELAIKVAVEPAPPVSVYRVDAPEGLERIIARCLEKDRGRRFQSVGELAMALQEFGPPHARSSVERAIATLSKAGIASVAAAPLVATGPAAATGTAPQTAASWGNTAPGTASSGKKIVAIGAAVALVILVVNAIILLPKWRETTATSGSPSTTLASSAVVAAPLPPKPSATATTSTVPTPASSPTAATTAAPPPTAAPIGRPVALPARSAASATAAPPPAPTPAPPPPVAPPAHKANCNPPYVIDSAGDRQYKPECL
jgi:eukaryotic-like serine/threonine-protein kinase